MNIDDVKRILKTENCILFCGAGFSCDSQNLNSSYNVEEKLSHPLLAKSLAEQICKMGGFSVSDNLQFAAEYYFEKYKESQPAKIQELVDFLKKTYTIKNVRNGQKNICSYPFRRIYTTNYDDAIEMASKSANVARDSLLLADSPRDYAKKIDNCVHINGSITKLTSESLLAGQLKLSDSSYVSSESFEENLWYKVFKSDIERANLLLFIGYSLPQADIDIKKVLFNGNYKDKTCFVCEENATEESTFLLKKYGSIFPVGTESFGNEIGFYEKEERQEKFEPISFKLYKCVENNEDEISDRDIITFFMDGYLEQKYLDAFMMGNTKKHFLVRRKLLDEVFQKLTSGNNIIIQSAFGNGKTIFLNQLEYLLVKNGYIVVTPSCGSVLQQLENECEELLKVHPNDKIILCFDGAELYEEFIKFLSVLNDSRIQIVMTKRKVGSELVNLGIVPLLQFNIDTLESRSDFDDFTYTLKNSNNTDGETKESYELNSFAQIITDLAFWSDKTFSNEHQKIEYLKNKCNSCISEILLDRFKSTQIKNRIQKIMSPLLFDGNKKDTVFAICLLTIMGIDPDISLISDISNNNEIYNVDFFNLPEFREAFKVNDGEIRTKSSLFALFVLQAVFSPLYIIDKLLNMAHEFNKSKCLDSTHMVIFKNVLRFSFVERLVEDDKKKSLLKYYDNLKSYVIWLTTEPSYWLQYGMAEIACNDYESAQRYFETAYKCSESKLGYDTKAIDNQQARLFLLKATKRESDKKVIMNLAMRAMDLLDSSLNDEYKFRQIVLLKNLFEEKKNYFDKDGIQQFCNRCLKLNSNINKSERRNGLNFYNSKNLTIFREFCEGMQLD